jgi:uncharacterized membrane-anchored protein YitT (DUF2179 family)
MVVLSSIYTVGVTKGIFSIISIAVTSKVISYFKNDIANRNAVAPESEIEVATMASTQMAIAE